MSQNDPTDNALAAIASILDQPPVIPRERERPAAEDAPPPPAAPPPLPEEPSVSEEPPALVSPSPQEEPPAPIEPPPPPVEAVAPPEPQPHPPTPALPLVANGYSRVGPGPMAAIRFRWTVREEGGDYYVDETIGEYSLPVVLGPMTSDAAVQLVNDREAEARRRFDQIKSEMAGRAAARDSQS